MLRSEVKLPTDSGLSEKMNAAYLSFKNASTEDKDKMTHIDKLIGHLRQFFESIIDATSQQVTLGKLQNQIHNFVRQSDSEFLSAFLETQVFISHMETRLS